MTYDKEERNVCDNAWGSPAGNYSNEMKLDYRTDYADGGANTVERQGERVDFYRAAPLTPRTTIRMVTVSMVRNALSTTLPSVISLETHLTTQETSASWQ